MGASLGEAMTGTLVIARPATAGAKNVAIAAAAVAMIRSDND
jgi:hypothetical protein